jgi:hypothetical protein
MVMPPRIATLRPGEKLIEGFSICYRKWKSLVERGKVHLSPFIGKPSNDCFFPTINFSWNEFMFRRFFKSFCFMTRSLKLIVMAVTLLMAVEFGHRRKSELEYLLILKFIVFLCEKRVDVM